MPTSTDFVPADLDASTWAAVEPLFAELSGRDVRTVQDLEHWLVDRSELEAACSESRAKLYINMTCDTGDEEAAAAYGTYIEETAPKLEPAGFELDRRQTELASALGLSGERYEVLSRDTRAAVELFREENVPLNTTLEQLSTKYQGVIGAMSVEFDGKTRTLPQMGTYQESADRSVRESAWRAVVDRRLQDAGAIDGIYDEQITLRDRVARNAGFEDYIGYMFKSMHRFDYTPADCRKFHDAVEEVVMPFCAVLDGDRATKLGVDALRPWDLSVDPSGRPPLKPFAHGKDLVAKTRRVMHALNPDLAQMFETLGDGAGSSGVRGGNCLDLDSRAGKAPGGYQYMLDRSRVPFIFMNAAGLHRDVETMVHEAGHAFHSMLCNDEPLLHYRHSPIEFAEVASMTMELLTMPHWGTPGGFYDDPTDCARAQRKQLEGSLSMLAWIATIDAFQHWVYASPAHTTEQRVEHWRTLMDRFGYRGARCAWDDSTAPALDRAWQAQSHLFSVPFYYIEYGIAQLGALQLWVKSLEEGEEAAIAAYKRALALGGSRPLPELFAAAEIEFDFSPEMFSRVRAHVEAALTKIPD